MTSENNYSFHNMFLKQAENQRNMFEKGMYNGFSDNDGKFTELPIDDPKLSSYHIQQLVSEIGEVLEFSSLYQKLEKFLRLIRGGRTLEMMPMIRMLN